VCGEGDGVRGLVAQRWALADGRAAMAWATTRAPREIDRVVTSALRGWIRSDPGGLSEWMEERVRAEGPRPAWLDGLLSAYAGLLAGGEPELALHWAGEIEDRDAREQSQLAVFGHWQKRDEEAAEAWIEGSSLSEVARARAREPASAAPRRPRRRPGP
jgi:hypothetical protein